MNYNLNLARFLRRDLDRTAKRGPTPEEVKLLKESASERRMDAKRKAAETEETPG